MKAKKTSLCLPYLVPTPVMYCSDEELPTSGKWTSFEELCEQAGVPCRATVPPRRILMYYGTKQLSANKADAVGVSVKNLNTPEAALRGLEALAHGFMHNAARHCVCDRGYFRTPTNKELGPPPPRRKYWRPDFNAPL